MINTDPDLRFFKGHDDFSWYVSNDIFFSLCEVFSAKFIFGILIILIAMDCKL